MLRTGPLTFVAMPMSVWLPTYGDDGKGNCLPGGAATPCRPAFSFWLDCPIPSVMPKSVAMDVTF